MPGSRRRSSGGGSTPSKSPLAIPDGKATPSPSHCHTPQTLDDGSNRNAKVKSGNDLNDVGFTATVVSVEDRDAKGKAFLWMSEAAMLAAPVATGSPISVSVVAVGGGAISTSGSVESLQELCKKYSGVEIPYSDTSGAQVAVAVAWPSRKLVRNEVRLSKVLALTMGTLPVGSTISIKSLVVQSSTSDLIQSSTRHQELSGVRPAVLYDCAHVSLRWCPPCEAVQATGTRKAADSVASVHQIDAFISMPSQQAPTSHGYQQIEHGPSQGRVVAPSPVSRSPCSENQGTTEMRLLAGKSEWGNMQKQKSDVETFRNWACILASFQNGKEKVRNLLEIFAARWISGRYLLPGNLVHIPLSGCDCIFLVTDAEKSKQKVIDTSESSEKMVACSPSRYDDQQNSSTIEEGPLTALSRPLAVYLVGHNTTVSLLPPLVKDEQADVVSSAEEAVHGDITECLGAGIDRIEYNALGGLSKEIDKLRQHVELSLLYPEHLTQYGLQPVRGVLLHGPPGTGKSSLARAAACEAGVGLFAINGPEIVSEFYGESEAALRSIFASAAKRAPSVVFIDELDAIAPARKDGSEDLGQRMVAALLTVMDGGAKGVLEGVLVIAASNRIDAIDPALRRPGRFDVEIEIGVPSPSDRLDILRLLLQDMHHDLKPSDIADLAATTHGFVGADLAALCNEAALTALRRNVNLLDTGVPVAALAQSLSDLIISSETSELSRQSVQVCSECQYVGNNITSEVEGPLLKVMLEDFQMAKTKVTPSAMREVALEVPKVRWSDIGGQDDVKQKLKEIVEWPQKECDAIARMGVDPPHGVLLYGPPGCSKTLMARAVASEAGLNFIAVKGPELFSKWVGESEKAVQTLFARARAAAPSVIFFDEIDGLAVKRERSHGEGVSVGDRVMSQLLTEMDGLVPMKGVSVVAATNRLDIIDEALLRPGRFDRVLYVGPPDEAAREQIFKIHLRKTPCGPDVVPANLAARTVNFTGADIWAVCQEAAMAALEEDLDAKLVRMCHFEMAFTIVRPNA